jgi:hypothetical protein
MVSQNNSNALITSLLLGRRQIVTVISRFSDWSEVRSGIPQGSVIGPTLFKPFINKLLDVVI